MSAEEPSDCGFTTHWFTSYAHAYIYDGKQNFVTISLAEGLREHSTRHQIIN
jgi:hypothetical protein